VTVWFKEDGPLTPAEVAHEYGEMALRIAGAGAVKARKGPAGKAPVRARR
jgi:hypothetical protein